MKKAFILISIITLLISCTSEREIQKAVYPDLFDGKYDSEFPYRNSSEQLENISNTVRLVNSIAFYRTYNFELSDRITIAAINRGEYKNFGENSSSFEETASGTGTVIYNSGRNIALLTCAHIINFPDSIKSFYFTESGKNTNYLQSFSVIVKQDIYVVPFFEEGNFEIIAKDDDLDIAILSKKLIDPPIFRLDTFDFPIGKSSELKWGTFVYVFGFPANYRMISKAIVSSPNLDKNYSFLIDAVANQGMSGGIVLAIRDGVPNFELVGMVRSAPANFEYVLRPIRDREILIGSEYKGPLILDARKNIKYGIAKVLSMESILDFIEDNESVFVDNGINPELFFK